MSTNSSIEWTEATWNPVVGCTRVSAGCDFCYAVKQSYRLGEMRQQKYAGLTVLNGKGERHFNGVVRTSEASLAIPLGWKKPRRVFVNSMSDLFHNDVPDEFIDRVFAVMALCPQHTFQVLTKRPERMAKYLDGSLCIGAKREGSNVIEHMPAPLVMADLMSGGALWPDVTDWPLPNVWLGTSVEDQRAADERIPHLLKCPAAVRFLSVEPLLGAVRIDEIKSEGVCYAPLEGYLDDDPTIHWVIVGGESGPGARPCNVEWIRSIVAQCKAAGVPCFVKQLGAKPGFKLEDEERRGNRAPSYHHFDKQSGLFIKAMDDRKGGEPSEWPEDLRVRQFPAREEARAT